MKNFQKSIKEIEKAGILLVFPIKNKKEPQSLWSRLYPRSEMRWDWDVTGDDRVVNLWHMMKELSTSQNVVYSKWYQNRATFFSPRCFTVYLAYLSKKYDLRAGLIPEAQEILDQLEMDSPLSTKEIKQLTDLRGRFNESLYNKAMKQLFQRGLIVGYGEKDDGAFPSSLMGATQHLFEDLWKKAGTISLEEAAEELNRFLATSTPFQKQLKTIEKSLGEISF